MLIDFRTYPILHHRKHPRKTESPSATPVIGGCLFFAFASPPEISNRNMVRLKSPATHTKQRIGLRFNRYTFGGSRFRFSPRFWHGRGGVSFGVCCRRYNRARTKTQSHTGPVVNRGPYEKKHALFARLDLASVPYFLALTPVSNRKPSRLESVHRCPAPRPAIPRKYIACSRLEIAPRRWRFVMFDSTTRCRWPTLAPGNMSHSPICTDSARVTFVTRRAESSARTRAQESRPRASKLLTTRS